MLAWLALETAILEAKDATFLLAEGNHEKNRDSLKKIGSNFHVADKSLAVEFKKPWNLLAEFNFARKTNLAACGEKSEISNWRREGFEQSQPSPQKANLQGVSSNSELKKMLAESLLKNRGLEAVCEKKL